MLMMSRCEWAGCSAPGFTFEDKWWFCAVHLQEHFALLKDDDLPWQTKPVKELRPCGTEAAARRHKRLGTPLCEPCRVAQRVANEGRASYHQRYHREKKMA